jgi:hypothetical protein
MVLMGGLALLLKTAAATLWRGVHGEVRRDIVHAMPSGECHTSCVAGTRQVKTRCLRPRNSTRYRSWERGSRRQAVKPPHQVFNSEPMHVCLYACTHACTELAPRVLARHHVSLMACAYKIRQESTALAGRNRLQADSAESNTSLLSI